MKCNSIEINELAAAQGGAPRYLGHSGDGDQRITLWELPSGEELIETNGDPVNEDADDWDVLRATCVGGADAVESTIDVRIEADRIGWGAEGEVDYEDIDAAIRAEIGNQTELLAAYESACESGHGPDAPVSVDGWRWIRLDFPMRGLLRDYSAPPPARAFRPADINRLKEICAEIMAAESSANQTEAARAAWDSDVLGVQTAVREAEAGKLVLAAQDEDGWYFATAPKAFKTGCPAVFLCITHTKRNGVADCADYYFVSADGPDEAGRIARDHALLAAVYGNESKPTPRTVSDLVERAAAVRPQVLVDLAGSSIPTDHPVYGSLTEPLGPVDPIFRDETLPVMRLAYRSKRY